MSGHSETAHDAHAAHDHRHEGLPHGTMRGYVTGFVLSVILTAIPFWLVMGDVLGDATLTGVVIVGFAVAQIIVHMIFFLHMTPGAEGGWIALAAIFTIIVVAIALSGSLWVMHHLNINMMPTPHKGM